MTFRAYTIEKVMLLSSSRVGTVFKFAEGAGRGQARVYSGTDRNIIARKIR